MPPKSAPADETPPSWFADNPDSSLAKSLGDSRVIAFEVPVAASEIFPFICPVRGREWIPGWHPYYLRSDADNTQLEDIFLVALPELGISTWVVSRYEPPSRIEFTIFGANFLVTRLKILLTPNDRGGTRVTWHCQWKSTLGVPASTSASINSLLTQSAEALHRWILANRGGRPPSPSPNPDHQRSAERDRPQTPDRSAAATALPPMERLFELGLTRRETEILYWIAQGKANAEIAIILGIATSTVKKHMQHVLAGLNVETRFAAALVAREKLSSGPDEKRIPG